MDCKRCKNYFMWVLLLVFFVAIVSIDGSSSKAFADPKQQGKKMGHQQAQPPVSNVPQGNLPIAISAGSVVQMTNHGSCYNYQADWINNNWLVYKDNCNDRLYKTDGVTDVEFVPTSGTCDSHPDVHPKGTLIAFQRYNNINECAELWTMDVNGKNQKKMIPCNGNIGGAHEPKWSRDGLFIAYSQGLNDHDYKELYRLIYPNSGSVKRLTFNHNNPQQGFDWMGIGTGASIITSLKDYASDNQYGRDYTRNVAKVGGLNGFVRWLTDKTDMYCELQPKATSKNKIVYMADYNGHGDIYIMNADGTNKTQLTDSSGSGYCSNHPEPNPSGNYIAYWSDYNDGIWRIWIMNADGSNKAVLVDGPVVNNVRYSWRTLKFNPAGTKLMFEGCTTPDCCGGCDVRNVYVVNILP
jgi:hypothetical protein